MGRRPEQIFFQKDIWMVNGHMKRCSTLLINIEMQIKITMKYHLISVRMDIIIKTTTNKNWWGCVEKWILGHCWCEGKLVQQLRKTVVRFLKKLKIELSYDSAITFLGIYLRKQKSLIHKDTWPDSWVGKESACNAGDPGFDFWVGKTCWRRERLPTPVFSGFPCGSAGKQSACNVGDLGSIPGLGR